MKKIIALIGFICISSFANAQNEPLVTPYAVPLDTITNKITYEGVIDVKGVAADELYNRFYNWFKTFYKNPTEVIRENDSTTHKIVGKPRFRIANPPDKQGNRTDAGVAQYTITVLAKDGRFKYELTDFSWKVISVFPAEKWLDTKSSGYVPAYNDYLQQLDKNSIDVIGALKKAVTETKPVKNKDNW